MVAHRSSFVDGFVVGVANPKTIVFFAANLPQFVETGGAPAGVQMLALGVIFAVIALASDSVWGLAAGTARQWFVGSPRRLELVGAAGGTGDRRPWCATRLHPTQRLTVSAFVTRPQPT